MMTLQVLWFGLWGLLWAVYFMLDGFDFGVGMLRNFVARDEMERKMALRSIGPIWDGNEVWLITAGGATFAAFPLVYASMFSFLYLPMLLILFSLIARGVAVEFRNKVDSPRWQHTWDWVLAISSFTGPLVLGLGFGNIFQGLRFDAAGYHGTFPGLFNGYGLLTALLFVLLFLHHGALWLARKTEGELARRSGSLAGRIWWLLLVTAAGFLVATWAATDLELNYRANPVLFLVPAIAVLSLLASKIQLASDRVGAAFFLSCVTILVVAATAFVGLYPNLIPSATDPAASLTLSNASSGPYTLKVMTVVALIFVPIVIVYQVLVYRFFKKPVTAEQALESSEGY